ncbi:MAG: universal stress protein [Bernardetiaceae bacterium]
MQYPLKRWLVALDLTEMDQHLIAYTAFLAQYFQPEQVYFIHAPKNLDLPEDLKEELYHTDKPLDEHLEDQIRKQVAEQFSATQIPTDVKITEGSPLPEILHWSKIKEIDLILVGKKQQLKGNGVLPKRLARRSACSILFVSETAPLRLQKIIVGTDFSELSKRALQQACHIAQYLPQSLILAHHVYHVPQGYHTSGKSHEAFAEIIEGHAQKRYERFVQGLDLPENVRVEPLFALDKDLGAARTLCQSAQAAEADIILITSRGRTNFAALLLGSFAEEMVMENITTPMLILKNKNKNMGVLDALLNV